MCKSIRLIQKKDYSGRIELMDAIRGIAVVLMVIHHFLFDCVQLLGAPYWLFSNPVFDILQYIFAGLFILLAGVSSHFSHSNLKRGIKVIIIALCITAVTYFLGSVIIFGILHLLGVCMLLYAAAGKLINKIPDRVMPVICIVLIVASSLAVSYIDVGTDCLWIFGWTSPGFFSADYYPLFPWVFVFMLGTWVGRYIKAKKFPAWFYETKVPFFPKPGRHALLIYVVHQPVLYGAVLLIQLIIC